MFNSANLLNIARKKQTNPREEPKIIKSSEKSTYTSEPLNNSKKLPDEGKTNSETDKRKNTNNTLICRENFEMLEKRKSSSQIKTQINLLPLKKVRFSNLQVEKNCCIEGNTTIKSVSDDTQTVPESLHEANKKIINKSNVIINKKDIENLKIKNSSFSIKNNIPSTSSNKSAATNILKTKPNSQNFKSILSFKLPLNQQNALESYNSTMTPKTSMDSENYCQKEQPTNKTFIDNNDRDLFEDDSNDNALDNTTCKCSIV